MNKALQVQEFAQLAGVTVRALHHYDRLGLLRPGRTGSGYRLYGRRELERLEQIVALKFIGIPLKRIKAMLDRDTDALADALRMQRTVLEEKRRLLDHAIQAIRAAEQSFVDGGRPDTQVLKHIIEVIEMQNEKDWTEKYYSPEARAKIQERQKEWTPELQAQTTKAWLDLFREVEAALEMDPASEHAQALGVRWKKLVGGFTGGDPEIGKGLNKLYADRPNWPEDMKERMAQFSNPKVWEYMSRVMKCSAIG
jgi:DNA-binding transcriptional MerR regulator